MSQIHKHPIPANIAERCLINPDQYKAQYQQSITDPDTFWGEQGKILDWMRPYTRVKNTSFAPGNISIKWYEDGTLNLAANCLDRHLAERGDQTAIIWEDINMGTLVGSYASVARMLDEVASVPGTDGVLLTFDDFLAGIDAFGERIQPLMRCRNHIASVTREVA